MKCYDFDHHFSKYLSLWVKQERESYPTLDAMEMDMPDVYTRWLNIPAAWLDGIAPGLFFAKYQDADQLIAWMQVYLSSSISVPDPLLERIVELGEHSVHGLAALLTADTTSECKMLAMSLLQEIDAQQPLQVYLDVIHKNNGQGEVAIMAAQALRSMGALALLPCLDAMDGASSAQRLCLADVVACFPEDTRVIEHVLALFEEGVERAVLAAYLSRMSDQRILPLLYDTVNDPNLEYLAYIELCNAIEALGGDLPAEREFAGDPAYETLRSIT